MEAAAEVFFVQTNWLLLKDYYWERRSEEAKQAHYGSVRALLTLATSANCNYQLSRYSRSLKK